MSCNKWLILIHPALSNTECLYPYGRTEMVEDSRDSFHALTLHTNRPTSLRSEMNGMQVPRTRMAFEGSLQLAFQSRLVPALRSFHIRLAWPICPVHPSLSVLRIDLLPVQVPSIKRHLSAWIKLLKPPNIMADSNCFISSIVSSWLRNSPLATQLTLSIEITFQDEDVDNSKSCDKAD